MKRKNNFIALAFAFMFFQAMPLIAAEESVKSVPIQHNGRIKAFSTFAAQQVRLITGKSRWEGDKSLDAFLKALKSRDTLDEKKWIRLEYLPLIERLQLDKERHFYSYKELIERADTIELLVEQSQAKRDKDERPSKMEQEAEMLFTRVMTVKQLLIGDSLRMVPPVEGEEWTPALNMDGSMAPGFQDFFDSPAVWAERVGHATGHRHDRQLQLEVFYTALDPFNWAWIAYFAAMVLMSGFKKAKRSSAISGFLLTLAFGMHSAGLILRVIILGRPPVSNMFESMVYMSWVLMLFAIIFFAIWRKNVILSAGAFISALVTLYGHILPIDNNLEVLVPVLRSNYWLTIHVMTIVSSYGAFGLATALGHRHLFLWLRKKISAAQAKESAHFIDRVIQLGVMLLGIGTVLGGVWANESWGRFWGWDPKETWALITFLAYLAVVHLRYMNKMDDFWLAFNSVLGFFFVLMTWYGVNFVLGRGLHSYGFGSGGATWIVVYVVLECLFLAGVLIGKQRSR